MVRLVTYLLSVALIATGLAWLADRPGTLQIAWQGYDIETSVFRAAVMLAAALAAAIFLWSIFRAIWNSPAAFGDRIVKRRQKRGLEALSSGMIAVGAGDTALATRFALQARKALPHEPLTHLLRAQAAQLSGDRATTRRIYEAMLASPDTEQLGLRGLFLEAEREGAHEAAEQYAGRALKSNPKLGWTSSALFDLQCKQKSWSDALETLNHAKRNGHIDKAITDRKRAILLAAQAQVAEEEEPEKALTLAMEAHALAPDLVPAAAVAGRIFAARGNTGKAAKVLQKTWIRAPHPDLAMAFAYARIGDSTRDRLDRVRQLAALNPQSIEGPIAVATTAIEARMYDEARQALQPLLASRLTQRVAVLMARLEAGENGDKGKVREWLARASNAAHDPVWIADGVISSRWEATSPVDGRLDAFQWRVPVEAMDKGNAEIVANRLEELLAIGSPANVQDDVSTLATPLHRDTPAKAIDVEAVSIEPTIVQPKTAGSLPLSAAPNSRAQREAKDLEIASDPTVTNSTTGNPANGTHKSAPQAAKSAQHAEKQVYVAPRAPDDPGLDDLDADEARPLLKRPYRAIN